RADQSCLAGRVALAGAVVRRSLLLANDASHGDHSRTPRFHGGGLAALRSLAAPESDPVDERRLPDGVSSSATHPDAVGNARAASDRRADRPQNSFARAPRALDPSGPGSTGQRTEALLRRKAGKHIWRFRSLCARRRWTEVGLWPDQRRLLFGI